MKTKLFVFLLMAALLFSFSACRDPGTGEYVVGTEADLTRLEIATVTLAGTDIPAYIDDMSWEDYEDYQMSSMASKTMTFQKDADIIGVQIRPSTSKGARVKWGIGDFLNRPAVFYDVRVRADFYAEDYLYLQVTSEDAKIVQYYRFYARVFNAVTHLASVVIDEKTTIAPEGAATWEQIKEEDIGSLALTTIQMNNGTTVEAIGFDSTSTFKFSRVPSVNGEKNPNPAPGTYTDNPFFHFTDQDMLYIEVSAQNTVDRAYYAFMVSVGRITTITKLELDTFEVMGKGFPNTVWGSVSPGVFDTADQQTDGFAITITLEDTAAKYCGYGILEADKLATENAETDVDFKTSGKLKFALGDMLVIKVTSDNQKVTMFYKVQVNLLPAYFVEHPRSNAYYYYDNAWNQSFVGFKEKDTNAYIGPTDTNYTSTTVHKLTATLDREVTGTYQWYEVNSWYGGYLFDRDGNTINPDTLEPEPGFTPDLDYSGELDEKANVSLFNGGNQKAQYVVGGRPMGASFIESGSASGTLTNSKEVDGPVPKISHRPFLPSFTNEAHYYYVVVTGNDGKVVTSERATIVSERDNRKKHYIVDVNNYFKVGFDPVQNTGKTAAEYLANRISFKNPEPFKEKYDKYKIFLANFASNGGADAFDIMDYKIVTAQAKFYLADGTPWIQNWTNGNLSFEFNMDDDGDITDTQNILVLYYNLTNNNAGYMLDGDSKEPAGANLELNPTHVVVEPSGDHTKGVNKDGYPPVEPWTGANPNVAYHGKIGDPVAAQSIIGGPPNGDLQGWFCGFVELVELRFEGPKRERE